MPESILAIDLGLTNCKIILFGLDGTVLERESVVYPTYHRQTDWVEQDPQDWWRAVLQGVKALADRNLVALNVICAISVTGHMHSLVCLGEDGTALGPCMILGDQRSIREAEEISMQVGLNEIYHLTGARMDASMPLAKICWLRKNASEMHRKARAFLSGKDWLRHQLTGDLLTDPVDACGTSLYDLQKGTWSPELAALADIRSVQLPTISDPCSIAGKLTQSAACALGLKPGIPVVVGAGDDVEVLGNGLLEPGVSLEHMGTTGSILTCSERLVYDPYMAVEVYPHVAQGLWVLGGSVTAAGMALRWAQKVLAFSEAERAVLVDPSYLRDPLIFVPHLAGERCPDWEPRSRGAWTGLSATHSQAEIYQAVLEGIAFSLKTVLERIENLVGPQRSISVSQRELQNLPWVNLRATIYNRPLSVLNTDEPTALGAMILAAVGIGAYPDLISAVQALTHSETMFEPQLDQIQAYQRLYGFYQDTAEALRKLMLRWQSRLAME